MHYEGAHIIRPPSEADSIILQVTVGCSHNRCTFCGTYKEERFRIKDETVVEADLDFAARYCRRQNRVFLADGDVLALSQKRLAALLARIRLRLPWVNRVGLYGNARAIRGKSVADLVQLKALGLNRVYMGLESGHDQVLAAIAKGADSGQMIEAATRVRLGRDLSLGHGPAGHRRPGTFPGACPGNRPGAFRHATQPDRHPHPDAP